MKLRHRVPLRYLAQTEPVSAEYQAAVDRDTERAAMKYEVATRRLAKAEVRLLQAREAATLVSARDHKKAERAIAIAIELVEIRRAELVAIEALMKSVPASLEHRGRKGYRPIPKPAGGV